jgi:uncharacterized RDD family membrane protein YckC
MTCPNPECPDFLATGKPAEYREGVTICPKCKASLVDAETLGDGGSVPDLGSLVNGSSFVVPVFEASGSVEAEQAKEILEEAGIRAKIQSAELYQKVRGKRNLRMFRPAEGTFVVLVAETEAGRAWEVLELLEQSGRAAVERDDDSDVASVGDASKARLWAAIVDNLIASALAVLVASRVPALAETTRWVVAGTVFLGYFLLLEGMWQATVGKALFGLRVATLQGGPGGWRAALIRTLLRVLEVNPIVLGGLPAGLAIMLTPRRQRIGDGLADVLVTRARQDGR